MDVANKIVTRLPLEHLWDESGATVGSRGRPLSKSELTNLLQAAPVQFVVVDVGATIRWIQIEDCYRFWKGEAKPHLAEHESGCRLEKYPDGYCYFASQWVTDANHTPVVVLEKSH